MEQSDKFKCQVMTSFGMIICISRFIENIDMSMAGVINTQNRFTFSCEFSSIVFKTFHKLWKIPNQCAINTGQKFHTIELSRVITSYIINFNFSLLISLDTICTLQLVFSVFAVCFVNMIFQMQDEFIQRLRVLIIGQLFTLISDITFFVLVKQAAAVPSYSFDLFAFLLGLEICYFVLMLEVSLQSESLMRIQHQQQPHSEQHSLVSLSLPTYDEAVHMIELGK